MKPFNFPDQAAIFRDKVNIATNAALAAGTADDNDLLAAKSYEVVGGAAFSSIAAMVAQSELAIGHRFRTSGYVSSGDGGENTYEVVAGETGAADGGVYINLDNGLQAKGLFPGGRRLVKQWGAVGDGYGNTDDTAAIAAAIAATSVGELIFNGNAEYWVVPPLGGSGALAVPEFKQTRIVAQPGAFLVGDTTNGPLLSYRAGLSGGGRYPNAGVVGLGFKGQFTPTGATVNDNPYDYSNAEGCLLAWGNDNLECINCSFENSPVHIVLESNSREINGRGAHTYAMRGWGLRFRQGLYACYFNAYDPSNPTTYVGQVYLRGGWMTSIFKAAFASAGQVLECDVDGMIFDNVSFLHAFGGLTQNFHFGGGCQYELGWSDSELASNSFPETLDFSDVLFPADSRYETVPFWDSGVSSGKQRYWGYADTEEDEMAIIDYGHYRTAMYFDRNIQARASVKDAPNLADESCADRTYLGAGSSLRISDYYGNKGGSGAIMFHHIAPEAIAINDAAMLRTAHHRNVSKSYENVARSVGGLLPGALAASATFDALRKDGVLFKQSVEYTIPANGTITFSPLSAFTRDTSKFLLMTAALKVVSTSDGADAYLQVDGVNVTNKPAYLPVDGVWKTFDLIIPGSTSQTSIRYQVKNRGASASFVVRVCDIQMVEFATYQELLDFRAQALWAADADTASTSQGIVDAVPTEDGLIVTTRFTWSASSALRYFYGTATTDQYVGPYFEIERMEARVTSGTPGNIRLDGSDGMGGTTSGYWASSFTPGSDWGAVTLAATRPPSSSLADSFMQIKPPSSVTMTAELRTKLRYL